MSSSSFSSRKYRVRRPAEVVNFGCNCGAPKLITSFFSSFSSSRSKSKHKSSNIPAFSNGTTTTTSYSYSNAAYTNSAWDPSFSSYKDMRTPLSPAPPPPAPPTVQQTDRASRRRKKKAASADAEAAGRVARESMAVVKETAEPYSEFKESMMQMIVEKEIYGWDDLNDLLHRFLSLNSPRHHHVIVRAFADIWNGVFSPPSPHANSAVPAPSAGLYYPTTSPSTYYYY